MAGDLVVIGQVARPHGVRGEVRIRPFTESAASFNLFDRVYLRRPGRTEELTRIESVRVHKNVVLLKLKGIRSRDEAEEIAGAEVLIRRDWLPAVEEDEYYWADLIGLSAFDEDGCCLGRVEKILSTAADDILVVCGQGREVLLPFRTEVILEVDQAEGRLLVRPPGGLLDL